MLTRFTFIVGGTPEPYINPKNQAITYKLDGMLLNPDGSSPRVQLRSKSLDFRAQGLVRGTSYHIEADLNLQSYDNGQSFYLYIEAMRATAATPEAQAS